MVVARHQFVHTTAVGPIRLAWVSSDEEVSVSFGLNQAKFSPSREQPHLTMHPFWHHLTGGPKGVPYLFEGLTMMDLMLDQERRVPWATASTDPIFLHQAGGTQAHGKPATIHEVWSPTIEASVRIELALLKPGTNSRDDPSYCVLQFTGVWVEVQTFITPARPAFLDPVHYS